LKWWKSFIFDSEWQFKVVLVTVSGLILVGVVILVCGIFTIDSRVKQQVIVGREERKALINEVFQEFQIANPTFPVPQIITDATPAPRKSEEIVVSPALESPSPSATSPPQPAATPRIVIKTQTKVRFKSRPTQTPWTLFPKKHR
jgi:hypothetical protein